MRAIYNYFNLVCVGYAFTDVVSRKPIYKYRDPDGVYWLKESRWAFFKVRSAYQDEG